MYGLHASNGILFNHESPLRGETFVTRKITRAVAAIEHGLQDCVYLGNLDALAFAHIGREIMWWGEGVEEEGRDRKTGKVLIRIDPSYFRPAEVEQLQGDARKAHRALGWRPQTSFDDPVREMVESDLLVVGREHQAYPIISNDGLVNGVSAFPQERATMA